MRTKELRKNRDRRKVGRLEERDEKKTKKYEEEP